MESRKMVVMNLLVGQQKKYRYKEQICCTVGKRECGANWESSIETYILPNVK